MYLSTLRSVSRPVVTNLRSIAPRRFTSTTRQRPTRSWKSSVVRLSPTFGTFYYFNASLVFAEAASQTIPTPTHPGDDLSKDPVTQKQRRIEANTEATHGNDPESIENPQPQSGAQSDMATNDASGPEDKGQQGAFNPETGEFNWDCSYLGEIAHGPCGEEFKSAFSCSMLSNDEPKGMNCIDHFKLMQKCFKKYPDVYGAELADDAEGGPTPDVGDEQPDIPDVPVKANSTPPIETDTASGESERTHNIEGPKKKVNSQRV